MSDAFDEPAVLNRFASLIAAHPSTIRNLIERNVLLKGGSYRTWFRAYLQHLDSKGDFVKQKAGLTQEQKLLTRIKKQKELGEWAPISALTKVLASTTAQMASTFDSIPVQLKRQWPELSGEQLNIVRAELSKARNLMVAAGTDGVRAIALAESEYADEFADAADDDDEPE